MVDIQIMDFNQYTKRPVAIKAAKLSDEVWHDIRKHCEGCTMLIGDRKVMAKLGSNGEKFFVVDTLEGLMKAKLGDMLIIGVKGEIYPCDEEIFDLTYEKAVL